MKIKKIHIAAFGKLINFSLDFSDGFNVLYGVNESGKSTLMYFVQTMFYGFNSNARKTNIADNDREHYRPWHSQMYGGTILFEHKNRIYSLERNFGQSKAKDSTRLVFDATGKEVPLSTPDEPGLQLFGMGKTEFLNTVFVHQMSSVINEDDSIKAKLVSLAAGSQMEVSADKMKASLLEYRKKIINDRKNSQSEMGTLQERLYQLDSDLQESYKAETLRKELTRNIDDTKDAIHKLVQKKEHAERILDAAKRLKEIDNGKKILELWQEIEGLSARIEELSKPDTSGRSLPTDDETASAELVIRSIDQSNSNLDLLQSQASSITLELAALPQIDLVNESLKAIESCEVEWREIEAEKTAIQEETRKQSAQFEQDDRELERSINQLLLDQKTMMSTYESTKNELSSNRIAAAHNKSGPTDETETGLFKLSFWNGLIDYLTKEKSILKPKKAGSKHWCDCTLGSSRAHISLIVSKKERMIRSDIYIPNDKELYRSLFSKKEGIENRLGFVMDWQELPNAKASRISLRKDVQSFESENERQEAYQWYKEKAEQLMKVFKDYI